MGQQQLLPVILVTILVGIATIVAMNVFSGAATDANRDAVRLELLTAASTVQTVYVRPQVLDDAGGNFTRVQDDLIQRLRMPIRENSDGTWGNENATYFIESDVSAHSFTIRAQPSSGGPDILVDITRDAETRQWDISIYDETV